MAQMKVVMPTFYGLTFQEQEKKIKEMAGEIMVDRNLYTDINNVPSIQELRDMERDSGREIIETARTLHSIKELQVHWGISPYVMYKQVFTYFNVKVEERKTKKKTEEQQQKENEKKIMSDKLKIEQEFTKQKILQVAPPQAPPKPRGLSIQLGGEYGGDEVAERLLNVGGILESDTLYELTVSIAEIKKIKAKKEVVVDDEN